MKDLTELITKRNEVKRELQNLNQKLDEAETAIKQELINLGSYECLTVRWDRIRRMSRE